MSEWIPLSDWRQLPEVPGVYAIRHIETKKEYVGQSKNVRQRVNSHRAATSQHYFGRALRRHGLDKFEVSLLLTCTVDDLGDAERKAIAERGTFSPGGYNLALGGAGPTGVKWSDERKAAQVRRLLGGKHKPQAIEKLRQARLAHNPFKGQKHTPETLAKIGAATVRQHTGMKRSAEACANISASLMGRVPPVLSPEAREKIRVALTGRAAPHASRPGELNPMYGIRGVDHPRAKLVAAWLPGGLLPHVVFDTATEAAAWAGVKLCSVSDWCAGRYKPKNGMLWTYL